MRDDQVQKQISKFSEHGFLGNFRLMKKNVFYGK